jgi:hypothetical protein
LKVYILHIFLTFSPSFPWRTSLFLLHIFPFLLKVLGPAGGREYFLAAFEDLHPRYMFSFFCGKLCHCFLY